MTLDSAIQFLLLALLAFLPLAFGTVEAWSELIAIGVAALMLLLLGIRYVSRPVLSFLWTWSYLPIALFVALIALQLLPMPAGLVGLLSPNTLETKRALLSDISGSESLLERVTLSFYSLATRHELRLIFLTVAVFVIVLNLFRRSSQIKGLLAGIAAIGGLVALIAIAQIISGTGDIYWSIPSGYAKATGGPFVNHSHFSQFMNLSIGAAMALLLIHIHQRTADHRPVSAQWLFDPSIAWIAATIVLGAIAVCLSLSRGGILSLLISGAITGFMLARRGMSGRSAILVLLALAALVGVLYGGFDLVYDRLATLYDVDRAQGGRVQIVKDIFVACRQFPLLGLGLGTHEYVFPMFDRSTIAARPVYAENEYAQVAEETGLLGLALVLLFVAMIWASYFRSVRRADVPLRLAAFGLGFGLLAVMIHSFSDFGQHLPAVACLSAVTCALLINISRYEPSKRVATVISERPLRTTLLRTAFVVVVVAISAWSVNSAARAWAAESNWDQVEQMAQQIENNDWQASDSEYTALLKTAVAATQWEPDNVLYAHWLNVYRWYSISRRRDDTGAVVLSRPLLSMAQRIIQELHQVRAICPTFASSSSMIGELRYFYLRQEAGREDLKRAYRLAPCDPWVCLVSARLDARDGNWEQAAVKLGRALKLHPQFFAEAVETCIDYGKPDLALTLSESNQSWLLTLAARLEQAGHTPLAHSAREKAIGLMKAQCNRPDAPAEALAALANIHVQDEDHPAAVEYYRRAVVRDYSRADWHLALARSLAEIGEIEAALETAMVCLRLQPGMPAAKALIEKLSIQSKVPTPTGAGN